jgi:hypothetical protein
VAAPESRERLAILALTAGCAVAVVSLPLAAADGAPYLSLDALSPWLVSFAIGLFAALFAVPFAIHTRLGGLLEADARWERALLLWGALTLGLFALGLLLGLPSGFASDSLAGSAGIIVVVESALVLATLLVWLISG